MLLYIPVVILARIRRFELLFGRQLEGALSAIERHIGSTINIRFQRTFQMGAWTDPSNTVRYSVVFAFFMAVLSLTVWCWCET